MTAALERDSMFCPEGPRPPFRAWRDPYGVEHQDVPRCDGSTQPKGWRKYGGNCSRKGVVFDEHKLAGVKGKLVPVDTAMAPDREIEERVEAEVKAAVQFSNDSPYPAPEEAMNDLFVEEVR